MPFPGGGQDTIRIDARIIRPLEIALELQIVGGVGEHEIDAVRRQLCHLGDAVADQDTSGWNGLKSTAGRPTGRPATRHNHDSEL